MVRPLAEPEVHPGKSRRQCHGAASLLGPDLGGQAGKSLQKQHLPRHLLHPPVAPAPRDRQRHGGDLLRGWKHEEKRGVGDWQDDAHVTTTPGSWCEYGFEGEGIEILSEKNHDMGDVEVLLDGKSQGTCSLHQDPMPRLYRVPFYRRIDLPPGRHTVRVINRAPAGTPASSTDSGSTDRTDELAPRTAFAAPAMDGAWCPDARFRRSLRSLAAWQTAGDREGGTRDQPALRRVVFKNILFRSRDGSEILLFVASPGHPRKASRHARPARGGRARRPTRPSPAAQRGHVAAAPDLPGIAEPGKLTLSHGSWSSLKIRGGALEGDPRCPCQRPLRRRAGGDRFARPAPGAPRCRSHEDRSHGDFMGGYMTTMLCGMAGERIRAGFSVYGCGFL